MRHVAYGIDWRRFPVDAWLDLMNEREHCGGTGPPPESVLRPPPLSRAAFGAAVRVGAAAPRPPDRLAGSPLVGTALGADAGRGARAVEDGGRPARRRAEGRPAPGRAEPDVRPGRADPGGRGRGARAAVQHLPPAPGEGRSTQVTELLWSVEIGTGPVADWAAIEHRLTWRVSTARPTLHASVHRRRCDMAQILVLGAGLGGLSTAMLLARDGHEVTVLERDPAEPPPPERRRRGVGRLAAARRQPVPAAALHAAALVGAGAGGAAGGRSGAGGRRRAAAEPDASCCRSRGAVRCAPATSGSTPSPPAGRCWRPRCRRPPRPPA